MSQTPVADVPEVEQLRKRTFGIAYRMTGSVNDAEELSQEAFARLERARRDGARIASPEAWLCTVATRLAIDHMRSARVARESYVGPWLPEPLLTDDAPGPAEHAEVSDTLSQAFLVVLETLSPVERAVFLLREVFGYGYPEIAETVGRREDNCRQLAARARRHVETRRTRFDVDRRRHDELLERFVAAAEDGDTDALKDLLAADAVVYSDGGGAATAARRPFSGRERIARFMAKIARRRRERGGWVRRRATINGSAAHVLVAPDGRVSDVFAIDVLEDRIAAIRIARNPEKLRHLQRAYGAPPGGEDAPAKGSAPAA